MTPTLYLNIRYCNDCNGSELCTKYNWSYVSKSYAWDIADKYKDMIEEKIKDFEKKEEYCDIITVCENCLKLCLVYDTYWNYRKKHFEVINIHHKTPVHTLNKDNLYLIWDKENLIALCPECHNSQDHQL